MLYIQFLSDLVPINSTIALGSNAEVYVKSLNLSKRKILVVNKAGAPKTLSSGKK